MTELDQVARDIAKDALARIETHEAVCAERQGHIIQGIQELKRGVEGLYRRFWGIAVGVVTLLLSACGALLYFVLTRTP